MQQLSQAEFIKRYKRFFADVRLRDDVVVAHVPNTGSLKTCLFEGAACLVSETDNPKRKLKATLHYVKAPTSWVGVDTSLPNRMVHESWRTLWPDYQWAKPEFKLSAETRLDLALGIDAEPAHYVEIKNVTLAENGIARFPDAVTTRGQKHLRELMALHAQGFKAEILFVIQRQDCTEFQPADTIDPEYGRLLREATAAGVIARALVCAMDLTNGMTLNGSEVPVKP